MKKIIINIATFSFISLLLIVKSNAQTLDWKLQNTGPSRYLENVEPNLLYFNIYANNYKRFTIRDEFISQFPSYGNNRYAVFLSEDMNNFFDKTPFRNLSIATSSLHSQNKSSSSFAGSTFQDYDWGQNIISYVKRPKTVAFVVNYNGNDYSYCTGDGKHTAMSYWSRSDVSLKENIETINNALSKVKQLRGVYFTYKPQAMCIGCDSTTTTIDNDLSKQMGLIAQEVEAIVPEVVRDQYTGHKAVAYQHLVGLLIEAVKELDSKINQCCGYAAKTTPNNKELGKTASTENISLDEQGDFNILLQNNPNPTTTKTNISYKIITTSLKAEIMLFDLQGALIKKYDLKEKGKGNIEILQGELKAGMYLYSLVVDNKEIDTKRMIISN
jgi:hypothetical protein